MLHNTPAGRNGAPTVYEGSLVLLADHCPAKMPRTSTDRSNAGQRVILRGERTLRRRDNPVTEEPVLCLGSRNIRLSSDSLVTGLVTVW